ncbi:MAG: hypothetical protein GY757_59515, partial [bacterium]|nr:hypothetical protein [bacterium]
TLAVFEADEDLQGAIDAWIAKKKYSKLLGLWVKGLVFDWNKLYGETKPGRISLPTYPFAKERYWVKRADGLQFTVGDSRLHPLVHKNTSDLSEQRFSSTFTGEEFFLADHLVKGERVLPGVAYLELARTAIMQAAGEKNIRLKNIVWAQPVRVGDKPAEINIGLFPEENGEIAYEIYSEDTVHSQGAALIVEAEEAPILDIAALKSECAKRTVSADECYEIF